MAKQNRFIKSRQPKIGNRQSGKDSRQQNAKRDAAPRSAHWSGIFQRLLLVTAAMGFVYGVVELEARLDAIQVDRVVFEGDLEHVNRDVLVERVSGHLSAGYLGLDLPAIQQALEQEAWVYRAELERRWPRELKVRIVEETPIAVWGRGGLLNHRAEVFVPRSGEIGNEADGLPVLDGPDGSAIEMMRQYRLMSQLLGDAQLKMERLQMTARGSWQLQLEGGVELVLGRDQILERLNRFLMVYHRDLAAQFERVTRVDTRYINGLAVSWRDQPDMEQAVASRG